MQRDINIIIFIINVYYSITTIIPSPTSRQILTIRTYTNKIVIEQLIPTIEKAIDKETIKNEIKNEIDLHIDKIKKSDSLNININQKPINNQKPTNVIIEKSDSASPKKKRKKFLGIF